MVTTPAPTLPNLQPATAPRTAGTPTAPPKALERLNTPNLQAALAEARRDADTLALGLRRGINGFRGVQVVNELRGLRTKIGAIEGELRNRGEVTA